MQFFSWQTLRRNWLVGIIGVLVTFGLVVAAAGLVSAKYVATSQMVLLPPLAPNAGYNGVVNPYLGLEGLESMADVVSSAMMDDQTAKTLQNAGVSSYSVQWDSLSAGPVLLVQVIEPTAEQASNAITVLDEQVPLTVARLQGDASISPNSFITAAVIARPSTPTRSGKTQLRAALLALVVGLILTLLAISLMDARRIRRKRRALGGDRHDGQQAVPAFAVATERARAPVAAETARTPVAAETARTETASQDSHGDTEELRAAAVDPPSDDSDDKVLMSGPASDTH
jgi:hypothetical protein